MKPRKTAMELRRLILDGAKGKTPFADAIDVSVERSPATGWVEHVGPPSGLVPWADCARLIRQIAADYREQFDLG